MARVAVDAMGGDHAPREIVRGAVAAAEADPSLEQILVGDEAKIRAELPPGDLPRGVTLVHAADVLEMHESPIEGLRKKADTSIVRCMKLVLEKRADAVVSAGNTGGVVAAATFLLPRLPNCRRAGIAVPMPSRTGHSVIMDAGANLTCKPLHLVQYALMAREYARDIRGVEDPRVALLSVGGEEGKGNSLVKETFAALKAVKGLRFIGNVEGQQIFSGEADVIICEGFVGNVILKASEGLAEAFLHLLLHELDDSLGKSNPAVKQVLGHLKQRTDYAQYGGAPLLGHDAPVFISHGRSHAGAMKNAIQFANSFVGHNVNARITESLAALAADAEVAAILEGGSA
jgi:glycerol-3-phosphate acyltransferase PlsX